MTPTTLDQAAQGAARAVDTMPVSVMMGRLSSDLMDAQMALDLVGLQVAELMTGRGRDARGEPIDTRLPFGGQLLSLAELGFTPTFYQFAETTLEVRMSVSLSQAEGSSRSKSESRKTLVSGTTHGARFASTYQIDWRGNSSVRTTLRPAPAPAALETALRTLARES